MAESQAKLKKQPIQLVSGIFSGAKQAPMRAGYESLLVDDLAIDAEISSCDVLTLLPKWRVFQALDDSLEAFA